MSSFLKSLRDQLERRRGGHPDDLKKPFESQGIPIDDSNNHAFLAEKLAAISLTPAGEPPPIIARDWARIAYLERENAELKEQNFRIQAEKMSFQARLQAQGRMLDDLRQQLIRAVESKTRTILPDWLQEHLHFLIFACHPDRNQGRETEASEVVKKLLEMRK